MEKDNSAPTIELWRDGRKIATYPLTEPLVTVGRSLDADIVLLDPKNEVSRYHAVLVRQPDGEYGIRDLGSLAGLRVNGCFYQSRRLCHGDEVSIVNYRLPYTRLPSPDLGARVIVLSRAELQALFQARNSDSTVITGQKRRETFYQILRDSLQIDSLLRGVVDYLELNEGAVLEVDRQGNFKTLHYRYQRSEQRLSPYLWIADDTLQALSRYEPTGPPGPWPLQEVGYVVSPVRAVPGGVIFLYLSPGRPPGRSWKEPRYLQELTKRLAQLGAPAEKSVGAKSNELLQWDTSEPIAKSAVMKKYFSELENLLTMLLNSRKASIGTSQKELDCLLIEGATGTGKEYLAQWIHRQMGRKGRLITINCANLEDTTADARLFGYGKGAFTGADKDTPGWFQAAHNGTLVLDDIQGLSLRVQEKLRRAVQFGEVEPLGLTKAEQVDVLVIGVTNRDLREMVTKKKFERDLLARFLRVSKTPLPPLQQRQWDIPLLAHYFLDQHSAGDGIVRTLSNKAVKALREHDWPQNIRELRDLMTSLAAKKRELIFSWDLSGEDKAAPPTLRKPSGLGLSKADRQADTFERILGALEKHQGNRSQAALALGIPRSSLYKYLGMMEKDSYYGPLCRALNERFGEGKNRLGPEGEATPEQEKT